MEDIVVAGISGLALVVGLVAFLRQVLTLDSRWSAVLALLLGQIFSVGAYLAGRYPSFGEVWVAVLGGLVLTLIASGLWSSSKALLGK